MHLPGVNAAQRLLFYRLKGDRLSNWDRIQGRVGCPHGDCSEVCGSASHTFWTCPQARLLWQHLLDGWNELWSTPRDIDDAAIVRDIFSLRLTAVPDQLWAQPELQRLPEPSPAATIASHQAIQAAWLRQVLATMYTIWRWRTAPDDEDDIWSEPQAVATHAAGLRAALTELRWHRDSNSTVTHHTAATLNALAGALANEAAWPQARPARVAADTYLLFFDGGSRGNPGAGGSGAVIVRVDASATLASIVWSGAMSSTWADATNNQAEYVGLITGLKAALEHQWSPLEVIGDSQMTIRQPRHERSSQ